MALLYDIPFSLQAAVGNGSASLVGAIIKDNITGKILGHVQHTGAASEVLSAVSGLPLSGFSPLGAVSVLQNMRLQRGIGVLQESMVLMQALQYGTLALSGLSLGVSVAGFAMMDRRLKDIRKHLGEIDSAIGQVTRNRRDDEIHNTLAEIGVDLLNVDTLMTRENPANAADSLQLGLDRHAGKLEVHFRREADTGGREAMTLDHLERLWTLAAAIRLCQEASLQALFIGGDLKTVEANGLALAKGQIALLDMISPDAVSKLVARHDPTQRAVALERARLINEGLRGGVMAVMGQVSIARVLDANGTRGIDFLREARQEKRQPLLYLPLS